MRESLFNLLENTGSLSTEAVIIRLFAAFVISIFIFISYRLSHNGSIYSSKFNVSLVTLTIITTTVMIVIGNNIALSLGMVGALSIVRFRTHRQIQNSDQGFQRYRVYILGNSNGYLLRSRRLPGGSLWKRYDIPRSSYFRKN